MNDDVQTIKDRLNIVDVVGQYVQLRRAGKNFHALCPFHKERTPSFNVSPERGTYMCFGCGEKGDIFSFVERIEGVDFKVALEELAAKAGVTLQRNFSGKREDKEKDERLREVCEAATVFFETQLQKRVDVQEYLRNRGVHDETKKMWRIGYAPASWREASDYLTSVGFSKDEVMEAGLAVRSENPPVGEAEVRMYDRFRGRIMFPISDAQGRVIGFSGRFFENIDHGESRKTSTEQRNEPAKYVNSPETELFKKSRILYGIDKAKNAIRKADCILLVEGQFDIVLCHQSGLPFTVALSGTALTQEHLSLLGRLSKRLVLALDADAAGLRSGLRSAQMAFASGFDVKIPTFPQGKDPADMARENPELLKQAIRTSKTAVEFFLEALRAGVGGTSQKGDSERVYKKSVESQILPLIASMQSKIEQEHFIRIVAGKINVPESAVREEVGKHKAVPLTQDSDQIQPLGINETELDAIEKKSAMLIFNFTPESVEHSKLLELLGEEKIKGLNERLEGQAEMWRFKFEAELGEHDSETIAKDLLDDIERVVQKERFRMKFL